MAKDKCPSTFSRQMETIAFIILQLFFATRTVLKLGECAWNFLQFSLSRDAFRPIVRERKYMMELQEALYHALQIWYAYKFFLF